MNVLLLLTLLCGAPQALADTGDQGGKKDAKPGAPVSGRPSPMEDTLMVIPAENADESEVLRAIDALKAKVLRTSRMGKKTLLVVKTAKGKLAETEMKLIEDKAHFSAVQRNQAVKPQDKN